MRNSTIGLNLSKNQNHKTQQKAGGLFQIEETKKINTKCNA